jgi:molybdate transport repressor ModE-like protein
MLDVRRLRVLREVAHHGSFSAAADALSFTQSAVSQQIAALEKETGTTLLQRGSGGVRLTDAGQALVRHTDSILAQLADAERELAAIAGLQGGRVRLASFPSAGATLVTEAVSLYRARHPEVELSLTEGEPHDSVPRLKRGDFDVAVVCDYTHGTGGSDLLQGLDCVHLLDDPLLAVVPAGHPLASRKAIRLEQLAKDTWVAGCGGGICNAMLEEACAEAGYRPPIAFESDDHNVLMGLVSSGVGVTLLPQLALRSAPAGVVVRPVANSDPTRRIYAATLSEGWRSPATEAMIEVLGTVSERFRTGSEAAAA